MNKSHYKIVFTGGHHTSSLVVARACQKLGYQVYWLGHRRSMWGDKSDSGEYIDVTNANIPFYNLNAGKGYRTYNPLKLIKIPIGFLHALNLLLKIKPDCIVSSGGYLAVPTVIVGWFLKIPIITHEQTVVTGWAARIVEKMANVIAVSWPESIIIRNNKKTVLTGLPLRPEILDIKNKINSKSDKPVLYITGGKQGSHKINSLIFSMKSELEKKFVCIHQTGNSTLFNDLQTAQSLQSDNYRAFGYSSDLAIQALASSDVVICRSGAHMCYELGYLGKKSVLIPLPFSSHNEQLKNAQTLEKAGLSVIVEEKNLSANSLNFAIDKALLKTGKPLKLPNNATENVVQLIKQLCEK